MCYTIWTLSKNLQLYYKHLSSTTSCTTEFYNKSVSLTPF